MDNEQIAELIRQKMPVPVLRTDWVDPNVCAIYLDVRNAEGKNLLLLLLKEGLSDAGLYTRIDVMRETIVATIKYASDLTIGQPS